MTRPKIKIKWNDWAAFIILSIIWGTSYILIKKSLIAFDSTQVASLRISIAMIAFLPVVIMNFSKIDWSKWYLYLIIGLAGGGIPPFLFAIAQTRINSGLAGALNTLTPIFTLLFAIILFKDRLDKRKLVGVIVGLLGAGLIIYHTNTSFEGGIYYSSLIILAAAIYAFNANMVKKFFNDHDPLVLTAISFFVIGPSALLMLVNGDFVHVLKIDSNAMFSLGAVTVLSVFSTVLATVLFFKLIQKSNAVFASSISYTIPIVAIFWGYLDGERYNFFLLISLAAILVGVYLIRPVAPKS